MTKRCHMCKEWLSIESFNKNQGKCRDCSSKWAKKNHPARLDRISERQKAFKDITHTTCFKCKKHKPVEDFSKSKYRETGYRHCCRNCESLKHKERTFGLTEDHLKIILFAQNGKCAICRIPEKESPLVVDHCHKTGSVRGLICRKCNSGMGLLGDDIERLQKAADYLKEFEEYHSRPGVLK